jgi:hypothetical protein
MGRARTTKSVSMEIQAANLMTNMLSSIGKIKNNLKRKKSL